MLLKVQTFYSSERWDPAEKSREKDGWGIDGGGSISLLYYSQKAKHRRKNHRLRAEKRIPPFKPSRQTDIVGWLIYGQTKDLMLTDRARDDWLAGWPHQLIIISCWFCSTFRQSEKSRRRKTSSADDSLLSSPRYLSFKRSLDWIHSLLTQTDVKVKQAGLRRRRKNLHHKTYLGSIFCSSLYTHSSILIHPSRVRTYVCYIHVCVCA